MGWTSIYSDLNNKQFVEMYLTDPCVIETSICGNEVYQLAKSFKGDDLYIRVTIIRRHGDGYIYYKDMSEDMGPCYYNCPEKFLKRSTLKDGFSVSWREACRKHAANKKIQKELINKIKNLKNGDLVKTKAGKTWIFLFNHNKLRFAGKLANVEAGKQNSVFAVKYSDVVEIIK